MPSYSKLLATLPVSHAAAGICSLVVSDDKMVNPCEDSPPAPLVDALMTPRRLHSIDIMRAAAPCSGRLSTSSVGFAFSSDDSAPAVP